MKQQKTAHDQAQALETLFEAIAAIKAPAEAALFFKDLCTPAELQAMADRWLVVRPIQSQLPYREIHEMTGVSVTTIGRVARCLAMGNGGYKLIYERVEKQHER